MRKCNEQFSLKFEEKYGRMFFLVEVILVRLINAQKWVKYLIPLHASRFHFLWLKVMYGYLLQSYWQSPIPIQEKWSVPDRDAGLAT